MTLHRPPSPRLTPASPSSALLLATPASDAVRGLGLDPLELEAAIVALLDRGDVASPADRARLERARLALESELASTLAE